jgi:hypothetical protein
MLPYLCAFLGFSLAVGVTAIVGYFVIHSS